MQTKHLAASLLAAAAASAPAQTATIYGAIDTGIEYLSAVGNGGSLTRVPGMAGGQTPSRWGLRGTENLGGDLNAVFTLENGFSPDSVTLNQGGRIFGRQAFVGLSGRYGTLTAGRQLTMTLYPLIDADVIGPAAFSMTSFDAYLPNARSDNSIAYWVTASGLTLGATYTLGRDNAPAGPSCPGEGPTGCKGWSLLSKYDSAQWGVAAAIDVIRGGAPTALVLGLPGGVVSFALSDPHDKDSHSQLSGYLKWGDARIGGGLLYRQVRTTVEAHDFTSKLYYLGASYPVTGTFSIDAQWLRMLNEKLDANAQMAVVRGNYNLSKRTALYAIAARMNNQGAHGYSVSCATIQPALPAAHAGQTGLMLGMRHTF